METAHVLSIRYSPFAIRPSLNNHQRFAEFDRLAVLDKNLRHRAGARRWNLVHRLHGFDDQERLSDRNLGADLDERLGTGLRRPIGGADHRRGHHTRMFGEILRRRPRYRCRPPPDVGRAPLTAPALPMPPAALAQNSPASMQRY